MARPGSPDATETKQGYASPRLEHRVPFSWFTTSSTVFGHQFGSTTARPCFAVVSLERMWPQIEWQTWTWTIKDKWKLGAKRKQQIGTSIRWIDSNGAMTIHGRPSYIVCDSSSMCKDMRKWMDEHLLRMTSLYMLGHFVHYRSSESSILSKCCGGMLLGRAFSWSKILSAPAWPHYSFPRWKFLHQNLGYIVLSVD